jgi:hypothetical protein
VSENVHFSARRLRFIDWLATTKYERKPSTQELLAAEMGINPRTLTRWKSMPELSEAVTRRARDLLGDDLPEIYGALRREAIRGSFQHIKLAMEMAGEYVERHELSGAGGGPLTIKVVYDEDDPQNGSNGTPETPAQ